MIVNTLLNNTRKINFRKYIYIFFSLKSETDVNKIVYKRMNYILNEQKKITCV